MTDPPTRPDRVAETMERLDQKIEHLRMTQIEIFSMFERGDPLTGTEAKCMQKRAASAKQDLVDMYAALMADGDRMRAVVEMALQRLDPPKEEWIGPIWADRLLRDLKDAYRATLATPAPPAASSEEGASE